jgi:protein-arginine kinase activator protein McsA
LHGSCIHITPEEADKFEVYVCPKCSTKQNQAFLNQAIENEIKNDLLNLTDQLLVNIKYDFLYEILLLLGT